MIENQKKRARLPYR